MKHTFLVLLALVMLTGCKDKASSREMEPAIAESFKEETGYDVQNVTLMQKDDYLYIGYVTLIDNTKAEIEVTINKENPEEFLWKVTQPSKTMIDDAINRETEKYGKAIDSLFDETNLEQP